MRKLRNQTRSWSRWRLAAALLIVGLAGGRAIGDSPASEAVSTHKGLYHTATLHERQQGVLGRLTFQFHDLRHQAPWSMFIAKLSQPVDLSHGGRLRLRLGQFTHDVAIKFEIRDQESGDLTYRGAYRRQRFGAGEEAVIELGGKETFDGLNPSGWQRKAFWPDWQHVQYVGLVVEARYNTQFSASFQLEGVEYVAPDGAVHRLDVPTDQVRFFEFVPDQPRRSPVDVEAPPEDRLPQPVQQQRDYSPEIITDIKRIDPSTALFLSGGGFKLDFDPSSALGIASQVILSEETHRVDALLINSLRKTFNDPTFDPRSMLTEPVQVRNATGSLILDAPDLPRLTFTYSDVEVDSQSSIALDFRQQVHEGSLLWTTPYLDEGRRWRVSLEPIYQYFRVSTDDKANTETRRDVHRGLVNTVLHDHWQQREYLVQVLYGRADHKDVDLEETEKIFRFEWRQWYGQEKTAFSTVGWVFRENTFMPGGRGDDVSRQRELFGNMILELDEHGRWRWFSQAAWVRHDIDAFLNIVSGSSNQVYDFYQFESRLIYEAVSDLDLSVGVEHSVADAHDFDSVGFVARASVFNVGPFRADLGARRTWYYNLNDDLTTFFFEFNFAR